MIDIKIVVYLCRYFYWLCLDRLCLSGYLLQCLKLSVLALDLLEAFEFSIPPASLSDLRSIGIE